MSVGAGKKKAHEIFVVTPSAAAVVAEPSVLDGHEVLGQDVESDATDDQVDDSHTAEVDVAGFDEPSDGVGAVDQIEQLEQLEHELETITDPPAPEEQTDELSEDPDAAPPLADVDALTPVPTNPSPGDIRGTPLLVGGVDLEDSLATLVAYKDDDGSREVLVATVARDAEAKLFEALALSEEKLVPVAVDKEVTGRLPLDTTHQLHEQLVAVAKSVNHHLSAADDIPAHTHTNLEKVMGQLSALSAEAQGDADKEMLGHYAAAGESIAERLAPGYSTPYLDGGKVPKVEPHETTGTVTVTEYVPAPSEDVAEGLLSAKVRNATRIGATVGADGSTSWDGKARTPASGKEYVVDLGDGYQAVYRPYVVANAKATDFSHRGSLEVCAPQGAGHGPALVHRLGQLNLVNRPMTAEEGEWAYLTRNVEAQGLAKKAAVAGALAEAQGLEDATQELLVAEKAHEAVGMSHPELVRFAKQLRLEAEAKALPDKVRLVREAVATILGHTSGDDLAASAGYDPVPRVSGGWLVWDRFDVAADPKATEAAFGSRGLYHHVTGGNLGDMIRNGAVLASTERRRIMGIGAGKGMSESTDMGTGGAKSVFLRVHSKPSSGPALYWQDPSVLLRRSDWYAYNSDHFGSINNDGGHSISGMCRDPHKVAGFTGGSNEVMFRDGIDLLGDEAPSLICCSSAPQRAGVLEALSARGITHLRGKPVEEVVQ